MNPSIRRSLLPIRAAWLPCFLLLASCGSPPTPPTVDGSRRHPVNAPAAVDLQTCRGELHDARLAAADAARIADAGRQLAARLAQQQQRLASSLQASVSAQRNLLVTVPFASGSTRVALPEAEASRIVDEARVAPLVVLRGRTDGRVDSLSQGATARRRALAVEDWLVRSGVERARIRTTWQPVGDHAADNATPGGRALNRRVEIEIYRSAPIVAALGTLPAETPTPAGGAQ